MAAGIGQVHVRVHKGHVELQGMGQTPKGQRYIKKAEELEAAKFADPKFKGELATAVAKLIP